MKIIAIICSTVFAFALWDFLFMVFGYILCRTQKFHKIGIHLLAMSMFVSGRKVSEKCHLNCHSSRCGNWTCENYYHAKTNDNYNN